MRNKPQQSTPQEAAAGFRAAATRGRWAEAFDYLAPEAKKALVGTLCMAAAYAVDGDDGARDRLGRIMQKYGLRNQETKDWDEHELLSVLLDMLAWFEHSVSAGNKVNLSQSMADTEYSGFRVSGDYAYAKSAHNGRQSEQRFKRLDGLWYLA